MQKSVSSRVSLAVAVLLPLLACSTSSSDPSSESAPAPAQPAATVADPDAGTAIAARPSPGSLRGPARNPRFAAGELIVKLKSEGSSAVTQCAARWLTEGRSFRSATADGSDSLDRLKLTLGVSGARPLFRERFGLSTAAARRLMQNHWSAARSRFSKRQSLPKAPSSLTASLPDLSNLYVLKLPAGADVQQAVARFEADPHVEYAQPNYAMEPTLTPNDPYFASSGAWGQSFRDLWALEQMGLGSAWDANQGAGVVVAVVDTGVDMAHPDLASNIWINADEIAGNGVDDDANGSIDDVRGFDFGNFDADPTDVIGHGTHVAGIIGAVGNNGQGVIGVAPQAKIMAVKGFADSGFGDASSLALGIVYAARNGADVINNSWGCTEACPRNPVAEDAVRLAHGLGSVVIFAAGNSNADIVVRSPNNQPQVVAVAASDLDGQRTFFSNFGQLDVTAPGGGVAAAAPPEEAFRNILSLKSAVCAPSICPPSLVVGAQYLRQAGTSMAAPYAAGVAALILGQRPTYTNEQARQALRRSSLDVGSTGFDFDSGYGRVDAARAMLEPSALAALITSPSSAEGATVAVQGIAAGTGFASYRVEHGAGALPTSWTTITTSTTPTAATGGTLASWALAGVPEGERTLRLVATTTDGRTYEDRQRVVVDLVQITEPVTAPMAFFRPGEAVTVRGTAGISNFASYTLTVKKSDGSTLSGASVTLTNGGTQRVFNGVLGTWNTAGVPSDRYTITLSVNPTSGSAVTESVQVAVDASLHAGWPKNLGTGLAWIDQLTAADLNGDGRSELLIGYLFQIHAFQHDGTQLPGWPQSIDPTGLGQRWIQRSPAVGDITGDGQPEVVAANMSQLGEHANQIFVWNIDGSPLAGWPRVVGGDAIALALEDMNGDGSNDIVTADYHGRVSVLEADGTSLPGFPLQLSVGSELTPPAVGDLDGDGNPEIVVASRRGNVAVTLYAIRNDGQLLSGFPRVVSSDVHSEFLATYLYPVLGDIDGNGDLEILQSGRDGRMYAYHHTAALVAGWPQLLSSEGQAHGPTLGDVNGDGQLDIFGGNHVVSAPPRSNTLFGWRGDGAALSGWPVTTSATLFRSAFDGFGAAALADIDGDGSVDIVSAGDAPQNPVTPLYAFRANGTTIPGFPKLMEEVGPSIPLTPTVADVDGDGLLEIAYIDFNGNMYLWDVTGSATGKRPWPMFQHDARHTGRADAAQTCAPETNAAFCARLGKNCGSVTGTDNCGASRSVSSCGSCTSPQTCGGGGVANVCGGGGTTPCDSLCTSPIVFTNQSYQSGSLGTNATCHQTVANLQGLNCGNFASGRTFKINGGVVSCNGGNVSLPAKRNGGYCLHASAGNHAWAYFSTW